MGRINTLSVSVGAACLMLAVYAGMGILSVEEDHASAQNDGKVLSAGAGAGNTAGATKSSTK